MLLLLVFVTQGPSSQIDKNISITALITNFDLKLSHDYELSSRFFKLAYALM